MLSNENLNPKQIEKELINIANENINSGINLTKIKVASNFEWKQKNLENTKQV